MEDYSKMSDSELRRAIAEAKYERVEMRWCVREPECGDVEEIESLYNEPDGGLSAINMPRDFQWPCYTVNEFWQPCRNWPGSIAAAWELVEEMHVNGRISVHDFGSQWQCSFEVRGYTRYPTDTMRPGDVFANASTAPRAICEAWLDWKHYEIS